VYRNCRCLQEKYRCAGYVSSRGVVHGYRYNTVLLGLYSGTSVEQRNTYIYIYIYIRRSPETSRHSGTLSSKTPLPTGRETLGACTPPNRVNKETMKVAVFHRPRFMVSHLCYTPHDFLQCQIRVWLNRVY